MKKTIHLTPKATKWGFMVNGFINSAVGLNQIFRDSSSSAWGLILGVILIIVGPLTIIYGIILFKSTTKLAPNVQVDENGFSIKADLHKMPKQIAWVNVQAITYKPFELCFLLNDDSMEAVNLRTNGAISIEIKRL